MKPFVKKLLMPSLLALLVWFTLSEHGGLVHRLLSHVYDPDYHVAEASDGADYTVVIDGFYWIPAEECQPVANQYGAAATHANARCSCETDDGDTMFIVVEIKEESKDGLDAYAPGGYIRDHEIILDPEGAMHPTAVLWLKSIAKRHSIYNGGPHWDFEQEAVQGLYYGSVSKLVMPYEPR
jgi:hypothetical protein